MKRIYYILPIIAIICCCDRHESLDPEVDSPRSYIFFDTKVVQTKASENLITALPVSTGTAFYIFGYRSDNTTHIFDAYSEGDNSPFNNVGVVYRSARNSPFKYDRLVLWGGGDHTFYAFHDGTEKENRYTSFEYGAITGVSDEQAKKAYVSYVQPRELTQMKDILTATTTASSPGSSVMLAFNHRLFALDVVLCNGQIISKKAMTIKDAKVEISNIPVRANIMFDGSYEVSEEKCTISYDFTDEGFEIKAPGGSPIKHNLNEENADEYSFLFIPCNSLQVRFECTIVDSWEQEVTIVYPETGYASIFPEDEKGFLPGKRYELRIVKSDRDLEATCEVVGWIEKTVDMEFN